MKNTFGKSKAAQTLEKLLENNPSARRKISSLLSQYMEQLLKITILKDPALIRLCMSLLRDHMCNRVFQKVNVSNEIKTYTKNVIMARYREYSRCYNNLVKMEADYKKKHKL